MELGSFAYEVFVTRGSSSLMVSLKLTVNLLASWCECRNEAFLRCCIYECFDIWLPMSYTYAKRSLPWACLLPPTKNVSSLCSKLLYNRFLEAIDLTKRPLVFLEEILSLGSTRYCASNLNTSLLPGIVIKWGGLLLWDADFGTVFF